MSRRSIILIVVIVIAVALILWWFRQPTRAERVAEQAATAEQTRLWQDVAARGAAAGLERLPIANPPLQPRQRAATPSPKQVVTPGRGSIAPGVVSGIRVVSGNLQSGNAQFSGKARVVDVDGERVEVELGGGSRLAFVARVAGMPLGVAPGQVVDLVFDTRPGVFNRREVLAVRSVTGTEIISAMETGAKRLVLTVLLPPLKLVAAQDQTGSPTNGALDVTIEVGGFKETMTPGSLRQVGGVSVRLLGSVAQPTSGAADASPYAIDLIAWRQGK